MSETDGDVQVERSERSPFDAKPLDADEYLDLLSANPEFVLRVSDGTGDGTFRFWVEDGTLFWRCLNWTAPQEASRTDLSATLDDESTTQLLIERAVVQDADAELVPDGGIAVGSYEDLQPQPEASIDRNPSLPCRICKETFEWLDYWKERLLNADNPEDAPLWCDECEDEIQSTRKRLSENADLSEWGATNDE